MKNIYLIPLSILAILVGILSISLNDHSYHSIQQSYQNISAKYQKDALKPPSHYQYQFLHENHWRFSPIYSQLEDVFYPFRKWEGNPLKSIVSTQAYPEKRLQLNSLRNNEKATKVRAMSAYHDAKRRNFKDLTKNIYYLKTLKQWVNNYQDSLQAKTELLNASYNNGWIVLIWAGLLILSGWRLFRLKLKAAAIYSGILLLTMILVSLDMFTQYSLAFNWILCLIILLMNKNKIASQLQLSEPIRLIFAFIITISALSYSIPMTAIGVLLSIPIIIFPTIRTAISKVLVIHPIGLICMFINKKVTVDRQLVLTLIGIVSVVCIGINRFSTTIALPMAYVSIYVQHVSALCLVVSLAYILDINKDTLRNFLQVKQKKSNKNGTKFIISATLIVTALCIYFINVDAQNRLNLYYFIWNPIIMWGSSILFIFLLKFDHQKRTK